MTIQCFPINLANKCGVASDSFRYGHFSFNKATEITWFQLADFTIVLRYRKNSLSVEHRSTKRIEEKYRIYYRENENENQITIEEESTHELKCVPKEGDSGIDRKETKYYKIVETLTLHVQ